MADQTRLFEDLVSTRFNKLGRTKSPKKVLETKEINRRRLAFYGTSDSAVEG